MSKKGASRKGEATPGQGKEGPASSTLQLASAEVPRNDGTVPLTATNDKQEKLKQEVKRLRTELREKNQEIKTFREAQQSEATRSKPLVAPTFTRENSLRARREEVSQKDQLRAEIEPKQIIITTRGRGVRFVAHLYTPQGETCSSVHWKWRSSLQNVAAIDSEGNITPREKGTTLIIATDEHSGQEARARLTVV